MSIRKGPNQLDLEHLLLRARHESLNPGEQRQFEDGLRAYPTLRLTHQLGRDFDHELQVRAGDDALILRASSSARSVQRVRRTRTLAILLGAAAAFLLAGAVAAKMTWKAWQGEPTVNTNAVLPRAQSRPSPSPLEPHVEVGARHEAEGEAPSAHAPSPSQAGSALRGAASAKRVELSRPSASQTSPAVVDTAEMLFQEAGTARRAGDLNRARQLYATLQRQYPSSSEARVSHVSLGKLLLSSGHALDAEQEFKAYLRTGERALEEEAKVGRASALSQLGKAEDEKRVWLDLLRTHPSSLYATRAKERLRALETTGTERGP